jgi:parallel beta-helix repeat protein
MILLNSPAGEYIGQGQTYYTTNQADITISGTPAAVTIVALGFTNTFAGPGQADLTVGQYSNARQYPFNGGSPGLNVSTTNRTCTEICGSFQVYEIQSDTSGQVISFWATFSQKCNCGIPPLTGEIRYNSLLAPTNPLPRSLRVPDDFPTIQTALNSVNPLSIDTVLVAPGVYNESIDFGSKLARLVSAAGPASTFLVATGSVAVTLGAVTPDALVSGFTIRDGDTGIVSWNEGSPTVTSNVILNCRIGFSQVIGAQRSGSPLVRYNTISGCSTVGIQLVYSGTFLVASATMQVLEGNQVVSNGAGIYLLAAGTTLVRNNLIRGNNGYGISGSSYNGLIVQNWIADNAGSGVAWDTPQSGICPWLVNNTIVDNAGAGIAASLYSGCAQIVNNLVVGNPAFVGGDNGPPEIQFNNIYSANGASYIGIPNQTGIMGNISVDPLIVCPLTGDYHLLAGSPCIDAGTNGAPLLPATDFDGRTRMLAGHTNGPAVVDMGAFEFDPSSPPTPCPYLYCPSNIVAMAPPEQNTAVVEYPPAVANWGAAITSVPPSGSLFPVGDDVVNVTSVSGTSTLTCSFNISVYDLPRALGASNVTWTTGGDAPWFAQSTFTVDKVAAGQSGLITNNQTSTLQATLNGPGVLTFWWRVSSEPNHDFLSFSVNGVTQTAISGDSGWLSQTIFFDSGPQLVEWSYSKGTNGTGGVDAGWLDEVIWTPGPPPPRIMTQPLNLLVGAGMSAQFSPTALGLPPLSYQWSFNDHIIPGATNSSLFIQKVLPSDAGNYSVQVTSPDGMAPSSNATLTVVQLLAWGSNGSGQTNVPPNLTNVTQVAGGWFHSVALKADGTVVAWGSDNLGQTNVPPGLSNVVAVASRSGNHAMALKADGTVIVWGDNSSQQTNVPPGLTNVVAISAGGSHCLALKADGTAVSWGAYRIVPAGLTNVVAVSAGDDASLFLKGNGTVAAYGTTVPPGVTNIVAIAAGGGFNLALRANGKVAAWGDNSYGQTTVPVGLSNVVAVAAGDYHSMALRADGTVAVWGKYNTPSGFFLPSVPPGLTNVLAIAAGSNHDLAYFANGSPPPALQLLNPNSTAGQFSVSVPTLNGRAYRLEYKNSLSDPTWTGLYMIAGNGGSQSPSDSAPPTTQRFYRVSRW